MRNAVVWGRRRQGKSTLALALALASKRRPVIIFDPCAQYSAFPAYTLAEDGIQAEETIFRVGLDFEPDEGFDLLMSELDAGTWKWADYALIIDEAVFLQKPQYLRPALARLIRQSPDDVCVIQTLHRPSETHPTVRALASDLFFFQSYLQRDLDVIAQNYGADVSEAVSKLGQHEVIHWWLQPGGKPTWKTWRDSKDWYIPIGETMPNEKKTDPEPDVLPTETPANAPEPGPGPEGQPEPESEPESAPGPAAGHSEAGADPVRELIHLQKREIDRLSRQNAKLKARAAAAVAKAPKGNPLPELDKRDSIRKEVPTGTMPTKARSFWNLITGEPDE